MDEKEKKELYDKLNELHDIIIHSGESDDIIESETNVIYWLQRVLEVGTEQAIIRFVHAMRQYEEPEQ